MHFVLTVTGVLPVRLHRKHGLIFQSKSEAETIAKLYSEQRKVLRVHITMIQETHVCIYEKGVVRYPSLYG